jgi:hypothetical protein
MSPGDGWITVRHSDPDAPDFMPPHYDSWHGDHTQLSVRQHEGTIRDNTHRELAANAALACEFRESQGLASCLHHLRTARLLPTTWQGQNAHERSRLLSTTNTTGEVFVAIWVSFRTTTVQTPLVGCLQLMCEGDYVSFFPVTCHHSSLGAVPCPNKMVTWLVHPCLIAVFVHSLHDESYLVLNFQSVDLSSTWFLYFDS